MRFHTCVAATAKIFQKWNNMEFKYALLLALYLSALQQEIKIIHTQ